MELWVEYLMRHGLPIVRPYPPFLEEKSFNIIVRDNPSYEQRVWSYFLIRHREEINNHSLMLGNIAKIWERIILGHLGPTVGEQREILFHEIPTLESLWNNWENHSITFSPQDISLMHLSSSISPMQLRH
jgi:hypothetical protein